MDLGKYLFSLKNFLIFSSLFFLFGVTSGFFWAKLFPNRVLRGLLVLEAVYGQASGLEKFQQFIFVIFRNTFLFFFILTLSFFFGLFPILVLFSNGAILGALIFFLEDSLPVSLLLVSALPYGIFEIPALITASSVGLKIAKKTIDIILSKGKGLRRELLEGLEFFLIIMFPFLILVAFIEVYFALPLLNKLI